MAKPPTGLTKLLHQTDGKPESIVAVLNQSGCLSTAARSSPDTTAAEIASMLAEHARVASTRAPGWCGPSWADELASMLIKSKLLNAYGKKLDQS